MSQFLWTEGGKGDAKQWVTAEQERVREFKKHECCLNDGQEKKNPMGIDSEQKHETYLVSRMWKLEAEREDKDVYILIYN